MKTKTGSVVFPLYIAGGDTYFSVLEELTSFICSRIEPGKDTNKDRLFLGKIAFEKYREKIGLGTGKKDDDQFVFEIASWAVSRFFPGKSLYVTYSPASRCWLVLEKEIT